MISQQLRISTGVENFSLLRDTGCVYVDKTLFLKELFDGPAMSQVSFFLRPRRFGKTLTLSMIQNFLQINYRDPEDLARHHQMFKDLAVAEDRDFCEAFMGRYPVLSFSLKCADAPNFEFAVRSIFNDLLLLWSEFSFLAEKNGVSSADLAFMESMRRFRNDLIIRSDLRAEDRVAAIAVIPKILCKMLRDAYGKPAVVLIDEYDVPLQSAKTRGFYPEMHSFIGQLLGEILKTNPYLFNGIVTGCLPFTGQSIFTGFNNFAVFGADSPRFAPFIGFTADEVRRLLDVAGLADHYSQVTEWYDGYQISGCRLMCPWSILSYCCEAMNNPGRRPSSYWGNTSGNDILALLMQQASDANFLNKIQELADGRSVRVHLREYDSYPDLRRDAGFDDFATLMYHTGYLTEEASAEGTDGSPIRGDNDPGKLNPGEKLLRIPNVDVRECFRLKAEQFYSAGNPEWKAQARRLYDALFAGDPAAAQGIIRKMLLTFVSFRDTASEGFYHGFMLGVLSLISYQIQSNPESGDGFADLIIADPLNGSGVIIEFKKTDSSSKEAQEQICRKALAQIRERNYVQLLAQQDCDDLRRYGIAFRGKNCLVMLDEEDHR